MEETPEKKPRSRFWRWVRILFLVVLIAGAGGGIYAWKKFFSPNILKDYIILVPENATLDIVVNEMVSDTVLRNEASFREMCGWLKYEKLIKPGRYVLNRDMTNWDAVRKLRRGAQDPVRIRFGSHWTIEETGSEIGGQMLFGEEKINALLRDENFMNELGFTRETVRALLIPNTYEVYWTKTPEVFLKDLKKEYDKFWKTRGQKLEAVKLTPVEVSTLASIVQCESDQVSEWPRIAGLYLNRLRTGMPLQADPTVKFAVGDYMLKRILNRHLETDSPYNTYQITGLPPGPIKNPEPQAIDAVLNAEKHDYFYMCAKADFSGSHHFSKTLSQHNQYADEYRRALDKLNL